MKVVFAGPSIYGVEPHLLNGLVVRGPAKCGDMLCAAKEGATTIGLIDGIFESGPSVWHKEILAVLNMGVITLGASSMGAIRAAECAMFGMIGVGEIYSQYVTGRRVRDADVAVQHAPSFLQYQPVTISSVDIEHTLGIMCLKNIISTAFRDSISNKSKSIFFKKRTMHEIKALFLSESFVAEEKNSIFDAFLENFQSIKKIDAENLLCSINKKRQSGKYNWNTTVFLNKI